MFYIEEFLNINVILSLTSVNIISCKENIFTNIKLLTLNF